MVRATPSLRSGGGRGGQLRLDGGDEVGEVERLADDGRERGQPVGLLVVDGGHEQDRDVAVLRTLAQRVDDGRAELVGQALVQDEQVGDGAGPSTSAT